MEIRTMQIDDYESVYSLWLSCRGMGLNDLDDSREGIRKFEPKYWLLHSLIFMAECFSLYRKSAFWQAFKMLPGDKFVIWICYNTNIAEDIVDGLTIHVAMPEVGMVCALITRIRDIRRFRCGVLQCEKGY